MDNHELNIILNWSSLQQPQGATPPAKEEKLVIDYQ